MATINLGRVGFVNKGTYSDATAYKVNDVVVYNSGTYACIQANTGQAPTNTSYWQNWVGAIDATPVDGSNNPVSSGGVFDALGLKVGKVTSSDNAIVRFNGTTGEVQNSGVYINDQNKLTQSLPSGLVSRELNNGSMILAEYVYDANGLASYGTQTAHPLMFKTNDTERLRIDTSGNVLVTGSGGIGYGAGAGGTVTQVGSMYDPVSINKPSGKIYTFSQGIPSGVSITFNLYNTVALSTDTIVATLAGDFSTKYELCAYIQSDGFVVFSIKNKTGGALTESRTINFAIIKGATA